LKKILQKGLLWECFAAIQDFMLSEFIDYHFLWAKHFFLARLLSHISRTLTEIEIHPVAKLRKGVY
jgi:serine acetyltransferase